MNNQQQPANKTAIVFDKLLAPQNAAQWKHGGHDRMGQDEQRGTCHAISTDKDAIGIWEMLGNCSASLNASCKCSTGIRKWNIIQDNPHRGGESPVQAWAEDCFQSWYG